jgi:hypothetical protein
MVERAVSAELGIKAHAHMLRHACGYALANKGHDTVGQSDPGGQYQAGVIGGRQSDNCCWHRARDKKLSDFKERYKREKSESVAALLTRAAKEGDEEAISLLAAGALERSV